MHRQSRHLNVRQTWPGVILRHGLWIPTALAVFALPLIPAPTIHAQNDAVTTAGQIPTRTLSEDDRTDIRLFRTILLTNDSMELRVMAATRLIAFNVPSVNQSLATQLQENDNTNIKLAIIRAFQQSKHRPAELIGPLVALLSTKDETLLKDISRAFRNLDDLAVVKELSRIADDQNNDIINRLTAIQTLGQMSLQLSNSFQALLNTAKADDDPRIRNACFNAMENLTKAGKPKDIAAWDTWWAKNQSKPTTVILSETVTQLNIHIAKLTNENETLTQELQSIYEQLFWATAKNERTTLLNAMLKHQRPAIRIQAVGLVLGLRVSGETIDPSVVKNIRDLLASNDPQARITSASALRDLSDADGMKLIDQRIKTETQPTVIDAYLTALERSPSPQTVQFTVKLFDDGAHRTAVVRYLIAARAAGLLQESQRDVLIRDTQQLIEANRRTESVVRLYTSLLANDESAMKSTADLLKSEKTEVARAAATGAFLDNEQPLEWADDFMNVEHLQSLFYEAYMQRANTADQLTVLLNSPPKDTKLNARWRGTIVDVARKLDSKDLLEIETKLTQKNDSSLNDLNLAILEVLAFRLKNNNADAHRIQLSERVPFRMYALGKLPDARSLAKTLLERNGLKYELKLELASLCVDVDLAIGNYERLAESTKSILATQDAQTINTLFTKMIRRVDTLNEADQPEASSALLSQIESVMGDRLTDAQRKEISDRRDKLANLPSTS